MVVVTVAVAVLRYAFALGWVWMQESYVWLHGVAFMAAAGYTLLHDGHVRVDILYRPGGRRFKAWVDLLGVVLLLTPFLGVVAVMSWDYVIDSWARGEVSREAGGLPALYLLKSVIWLFCALMFLQGIALAGRSFLVLAGREALLPPGPDGAEERV